MTTMLAGTTVTCPKCGNPAKRLHKIGGGSYFIHREEHSTELGTVEVESCETKSTGLKQLEQAWSAVNGARLALHEARAALEECKDRDFSGLLEELSRLHTAADQFAGLVDIKIADCNDEYEI